MNRGPLTETELREVASLARHLRYAAALLGTYMLSWTASYIFVFVSRGDGLDFSYYFQYFRLAWTFNGLEIPSFIWLFSIVAFVPLAALVVILMRRYDRPKHNNA